MVVYVMVPVCNASLFGGVLENVGSKIYKFACYKMEYTCVI